MKKNKRIVVTGATGNIGSELSYYLASKGYDLFIASRSETKLKLLQEKITNQFNVKVDHKVIDFSIETSIKDITRSSEGFGNINGLVLIPPKIEPTSECFPSNEKWEHVFKQTFINPLSLIRELIPYFDTDLDRAKVVILSGISSVQAMMNYSMNNAIRTAWIGQAKTLALFYGEQKIHFNTLSLGGVMTESFVKQVERDAEVLGITYDDLLRKKISNVPLRKYATLIEVSSIIESLLSEFTDHITGSNIVCDGGFIKTY